MRKATSAFSKFRARNAESFSELLWEMIQWPDGEPEKASRFCPRCGAEIEEKLKPELVERGRWRPLRPEVGNAAIA